MTGQNDRQDRSLPVKSVIRPVIVRWLAIIFRPVQWINKSQLIECDVPEVWKIVIVMGGATRAMQQAMNVQ